MINWDAIGAIGEIVGAVAVVATLAYLSIQIRQSGTATQSARLDGHFQMINDLYKQLNDEQTARIWSAGISDFGSLNNADQIRFHSLAIQAVLNYEAARNFVLQGLYSEKDLEPEENWIIALLNTPGGREWWDASESDFNADLRGHVKRLSESYKPNVPDPSLKIETP